MIKQRHTNKLRKQQLLCHYARSTNTKLAAPTKSGKQHHKQKINTYHTCNLNANKHGFIVHLSILIHSTSSNCHKSERLI